MERGRCKIPCAKKSATHCHDLVHGLRDFTVFQKVVTVASPASFSLAPNTIIRMATLSVAASEADHPTTALHLLGQILSGVRLSMGHSQLDLDLSGLPAGINLVRVQQADGLITTEKLMKE